MNQPANKAVEHASVPSKATPHGLLPPLPTAPSSAPAGLALFATPQDLSPALHPINRAVAQLLHGAVRGYQLVLRPWLGEHCRHYPSCSHYALQALREHGALRGAALTAWRLCRCHPFSAGGYDPVPSLKTTAQAVDQTTAPSVSINPLCPTRKEAP